MEAIKCFWLKAKGWYFDLGVSNHIDMTNRKNWFVSFAEDRSRTKTIVLGGGKIHVVEGHGGCTAKLSSGMKSIFENVFYISGLNKNLFFCQMDLRTKLKYN